MPSSAAMFGPMLLAATLSADVIPSLVRLKDRADVIVAGYVSRVDGTRLVSIEVAVTRVLKRSTKTGTKLRRLKLSDTAGPRRKSIGWIALRNDRTECVFFLNDKQGRLSLIDSSMGVIPTSRLSGKDLKSIGYKHSIQWVRVAGLVGFFIFINGLLIAAAKSGKSNSEDAESDRGLKPTQAEVAEET